MIVYSKASGLEQFLNERRFRELKRADGSRRNGDTKR